MKKQLLLILLSFMANLALAQDVWLQNHFSPNSGTNLSNAETVTVLVNNNSGVIMPSNTIQVNYTVNGGATVSQMLSSNLTAGSSWNFSFSVKANLSVYGTYFIKVWVVRAGDVNQLNNTLEWTVQNDCIVMNQPQNKQACNGVTTAPVNFSSSASNVVYSWTNSNPSIGLAVSGKGNLPSFNAVNTGTSAITSTITVTPKFENNQTFDYTGTMQTFVVPAGVTSIKVDARGSKGGDAIYNQPGTKPDDLGGKGGRVVAEYPVTPGQTLYIFVGGIGYNGGGNGAGGIAQPNGGGASDIRIGGMALTNRIIVAGGGGGGGNNCSNNAEPGGAGGGLIGETGFQCGSQTGTAVGQGGNQSGGGAPGTSPATAGALGVGGNAGGAGTASGGGGGGYYGGGGAAYGGGGGGSSYTDPLATSVEHVQGFQNGTGQVIITYGLACVAPATKTFTYTIEPTPDVIASPSSQIVGSGQAITPIVLSSSSSGVTYSWTRQNILNATGMPNNGTGNISGTLINATASTEQTVNFTIIPHINGCDGVPITATVILNAPYTPDANGILYVKKGATGIGTSWSNAIGELAEALRIAKTNNAITQIWVAKGTYKPMYSPADNNFGNADGRNNVFLLVKDVKIYGGFDPDNGISDLATRNPQIATTTLSGDFNGDDMVSGDGSTLSITNNTENAYHVLISAGAVGTAELNGFTITGGNGTGTNITVNSFTIFRSQGGGMNIASSSPNITNCVFKHNNVQTGMGGALYINATASTPVISKTSFLNNKSSNVAGQGWGEEGGAGLFVNSSSPIITDCSFTGNLTTGSRLGGAIINTNSLSKFSNVSITNNASFGVNGGGGGLANFGTSNLELTNVTFSGNSVDGNGGAIYNSSSSSSMVMSNVLITGNTANNGPGIYNSNASPVLTNVTISGNQSNVGGAIYNINGSSPSLKNTIVFGNSTGITNNAGVDLPVYKNSLVEALSGTGLINFAGLVTDVFVSPLAPSLATGGDYTLKIGSPAINSGDNTLFTGLDTNTKDLAGNPRLTGTNIDLGAYEALTQPQTINPIANIAKTYGDASFEPGATATSGLTISYASADNSIAEAYQDAMDGNKWKVNIKKAGLVNITASQTGGNGYDAATPLAFSLTINKKPVALALTSTLISKQYDANTNATIATSDLSFATGSIVGTDNLSILLTSTTANYDDKNVGLNKAINIPLGNVSLSGTAVNNYQIANTTDIIANVGTITQKALTVKANNQTKTYDGAPYSGGNGVSYTGFALGDNEINALNGILEYEGTSQGAINTGNYTIVPKGYTSNNYSINYTNGNLLVTASIANVLSFNAQTGGSTVVKTYGDGSMNASAVASSNLSASYGSSNTAVASINAQGQVEIKGTGTTVITASQAGDINYQPATAISFTVQVNKKTIDVKANDYSKTFDAIPYTGGNGVSYAGFAYGESSAVLTGSLVYTGTSQGAVNTGNYQIIPSGLTGNNYDLNYIAGTLNIIQSGSNVITFNSQTAGANLNVTYGNGNIDASAVASSGLTITYVSSNPVVAQVGNNGTVTVLAAGSTTITASQPGDANQAAATPISFTINVQKKALTITANNANKVYDAQAYTGDNGVSYTGFVTGESQINLQGVLSYTGTAIGATTVGSYFISPTGYTSNNYAITYQDGSLTITKAVLTITAEAKTKTYGDADPILTYTVTGLVGTDVLTGTLTRTTGENVGVYAIDQGSLSAGANYTVTYTAANFYIIKKSIGITAEAKTKTYGDADPALTYTVTGLVGTDALIGALARAIGENVGAYAINQGSLSAGANYTVNYTTANLDIVKKTINITAQAKTKTYSDLDPAFTYTVTGLVGTDMLTGTLSRAIGENVGSYAISLGSLSAGANYMINYSAANLSITKATLTVTAENKQVCQGLSFPIFTTSYLGFKLNDNENSLTTKPTVSTTANSNSPAGNFILSPVGGQSANYNFAYVNGNLTIYAKPVPVIASNRAGSISKGETVVLIATGGTIYNWNNANGIISGQNTATLTARPTVTTTYTVTITNANGCSETTSYTVEVRDDFQAIKANNILSPNGDGINDYWVVDNIDMYPNNIVTIFDRAGRILFTQKGYKNTWDGTVNGSPLAENTYYYIIDFGTNKLKQKGYITLLRQL